jgi:hypothetical protein
MSILGDGASPNAAKGGLAQAALTRLAGAFRRKPRAGARRILKPYRSDPHTLRRGLLRLTLIVVASLFCLIYGAAFALFAPYLMPLFAAPLLILAALAVWALPETGKAPTRIMIATFWAFFVSVIMWPNYLAIALPGMPWITLIRLSGFPMALALLVAVSQSRPFRSTVATALKTTPLLWQLFTGFIITQFFSLAFSDNIGVSIDKLLVAQMSWTAIFFISVYAFQKPGRAETWVYVLSVTVFFICVLALIEYKQQRVLWAGHVPSFLQVSDPDVALYLQGQHRVEIDGNHYRAQATFSTSIGLSEYLGLCTPFMLHLAVQQYRVWVRFAAAAMLPFMFFIVLATDSHVGSIGTALTYLLYPLFWAAIRWRRQAKSLLAPAVVLAYPTVFCLFVAGSFVNKRLHSFLFGGADHKDSTQARLDQWSMGIPKILSHPWGYGIGRGGIMLNYRSPSGRLTIDTYNLLVLLDYGVLGFIAFFGTVLAGIWYSGRHGYQAPDSKREYSLLIPITIALINFFIGKSVFAQQENHPIIFMMLGMVVALAYRMRTEQQAPQGSGTALTVDGRRARAGAAGHNAAA